MKKLMAVMAVIAIAAVVVSSPAEARRGSWGGYPVGGYYDLTATPGLNLTAEQSAKLTSLRENHLREAKPLQDQIYSKRGELRLLWLQQTVDQKKILSVQTEVRNLRDQLADKQTSYRLESQKVLTPEQLTKFQAYGAGRGYGYAKGMRGQGGGMVMAPGMGQGMGMRGY
ncbi:MAG: Spy/CpxP family protein refolding chaperone [Deltaproteobacteria bacterium]|nr:Spy/CpxP family protein refolding chaperone [Deltaproteobacteria bacterium]